jgi:hypothetical protein
MEITLKIKIISQKVTVKMPVLFKGEVITPEVITPIESKFAAKSPLTPLF